MDIIYNSKYSQMKKK